MSNPYQLVVFDWEGTIADTIGLILQRVAVEANRLGFGQVDPYAARSYVGLGLHGALRKLFSHLSNKEHELLVHAVQNALLTKHTEVFLIPGARPLIQKLQDVGVDLAIASNKGQHALARALQETALTAYFKVTRSAGQAPAKPCSQMLEEIMDVLGHTSSTTLMIGDSPTDMETAKALGVHAVGVDFYHQNKEILKDAGAMAVFDDYQLLADFLKLPPVSRDV
jgi:phosphoglycolate phosphatase